MILDGKLAIVGRDCKRGRLRIGAQRDQLLQAPSRVASVILCREDLWMRQRFKPRAGDGLLQ